MTSDFSSNYFELFGLPVSYRLDSDALSQRFRKLQQAAHPDRYASAGDQERRLSVQMATRINEAYQVLKDPLKRAGYILELNNIRWDDERDTSIDPAFLMEQMELRESIEDVRAASDPLDVLGKILDRVLTKVREMQQQLESSLSEINDDSLQAAKETVRQMQFIYKLRDECEALEAELEDAL